MSPSPIHVIGGGLLGMLTSRELALAGYRVTLLEQGVTGRESSWAGGGILSPLHPWRYPPAVTALAFWGQSRYPVLAEELRHRTGIDPEWVRSGLLWLSTEEKDQAFRWAQAAGQDLQWLLGEEAVHGCEPALAPGFAEAMWMPGVAQVRNPRLLKAVRADITRLGVQVREGCHVTGLDVTAGRIRGLLTSDQTIAVDQAVVTAGSWSGTLLEPIGLDLPVRPMRGQMLLFRADPGTLSRMVLHRERYLIPRRDGRILAGSTVEDVGFDKTTTSAALEELRAAAIAMIPALAHWPVERHWAGLRPGSPTGVPFVGACPGVDGLWVNTGHFRNGVVLGLASSRLLADLILGREPVLDPTPYAPGRSQ